MVGRIVARGPRSARHPEADAGDAALPASMTCLNKVWLATKRGGGSHLQRHRSSPSANSLPSKRSPRRGPSGSITPVAWHVGQDTGSPAQATRAPLIVWVELPDKTLPPAVVLAPAVMRYRMSMASFRWHRRLKTPI